MRRALILLAVILAASVFGVSPSRAQFAACDQNYVNSFAVAAYGTSPAWSPGTIECVEYFRLDFDTPHGRRWVRGIGDVNVDSLIAPGGIAAIREGARRATQRMAALGEYDIDNTTILITFSTSDPISTERKEGGSTAWTMEGQGPERDECHVTLFLLGDYNVTGEMQFATAHELFHCVQKASLSEAQNNSAAAYGLWWIEGSAELFASAAVGIQPRWNDARKFDEAVEHERPLYAMTYEAAVYFFWQHQREGFGALMPFLRGMADDPSEAAQRAAMRRMSNAAKFLEFAEAYDDRTITGPDGTQLPFGLRHDGEQWTIDATSTQRSVLKPFVIMVGSADYACGTWSNTIAPGDANMAVRPDASATWGVYPAEMENRTGARALFRRVAMNTGDENVDLSVRVTRRASCEPCLARSVIDQCVVGVWEQSGGGPMAWLRAQGMPQVTRDNMGKLMLEMSEDGTFAQQNVPIDYQITIPGGRHGPIISDAVGGIRPASGRWSAQEGRLSACFDSGGGSNAVVTMQAGGHTRSMNSSTPSLNGFSGSSSYTCSDTTLTTSSPMPRGGEMRYEFRRLTPPPAH